MGDRHFVNISHTYENGYLVLNKKELALPDSPIWEGYLKYSFYDLDVFIEAIFFGIRSGYRVARYIYEAKECYKMMTIDEYIDVIDKIKTIENLLQCKRCNRFFTYLRGSYCCHCFKIKNKKF